MLKPSRTSPFGRLLRSSIDQPYTSAPSLPTHPPQPPPSVGSAHNENSDLYAEESLGRWQSPAADSSQSAVPQSRSTCSHAQHQSRTLQSLVQCLGGVRRPQNKGSFKLLATSFRHLADGGLDFLVPVFPSLL